MLNNIYFFIITGTSYDDSSTDYYRLVEDRSSSDDPILDMQFSEKPDGYSGSEDDDSDEDDCDHSHHAKKKPGILCYIHKSFVL